jgi:hypothetical protein
MVSGSGGGMMRAGAACSITDSRVRWVGTEVLHSHDMSPFGPARKPSIETVPE